MSGILYLFMSAMAMFLWGKTGCAICISSFDIGFWGRSWYLWGAVFYATTAMFAFRLKKNWLVTMAMAGGIIFHASLNYSVYQDNGMVCSYCIGFLITEFIAVVAYQFEKSRMRDYFFAWGPARSAAVIAVVLFFLNPTAGEINSGDLAFASAVPERITANQVVYNSPNVESDKNLGLQTEKGMGTESKVNGQSTLTVYGQDGTKINLSLNKRPALLFAWWCPHCDDALKSIAKLPPWKRPYPVVVYLQGNNDDTNIRQKLKSNGLPETVYYIYKDMPPVDGVPVLLWFKDGLQKSFDIDYKQLDEITSQYMSEPKWGYNVTSGGAASATVPGTIKYRPISNQGGVLRYLSEINSMLADNKYLDALDAAGKKYNIDPLLLLAITGQEQSFVPKDWPNTDEMIKNPFNVYGSWQVYAPGFAQSAYIAAQTVNRLSANCPVWMNPIQWIDSPENPNCRYAEDTNWWMGVEYYYTKLKEKGK